MRRDSLDEFSIYTRRRGIFAPLATLGQTPMNRNEADVTTATAPTQAVLTAGDRCDRCGAQAYLRVELQTGGELLFCAHHAREHGEKLREIAAAVHDETHKLDTPSAGSEA
jgi:hypothetical protein